MNGVENMNTEELKAKLAALKENLAEIEEERIFVLSQTGLHVPGGKVKQYAEEISVIKKQIKLIEEELQRRNRE